MSKQDLPTCPDTEHQFAITKWEVKTAERRIPLDDGTIEAETIMTQRAITLVCTRCTKVQPAPPKGLPVHYGPVITRPNGTKYRIETSFDVREEPDLNLLAKALLDMAKRNMNKEDV